MKSRTCDILVWSHLRWRMLYTHDIIVDKGQLLLTGLILQGICSLDCTMLETQLDARLEMYLHFDARL